MSSIDELRAAMKAAQPSGRSAYVEEGKHLLEVKILSCKHSLVEGKQKEAWIAEFNVIESTNPSHVVGTTRAYIEVPENQGWLGRFKSCLLALLGVDPSGVVSPEAEKSIGDIFVALRYDEERIKLGLPENFMAGRRVVCEGSKGLSRKGGPVTNKLWSPVAA